MNHVCRVHEVYAAEDVVDNGQNVIFLQAKFASVLNEVWKIDSKIVLDQENWVKK